MIELVHTLLSWFELSFLAFCLAVLVFRLPVFAPSLPVARNGYQIFRPGVWGVFALGVGVIVLASIGDLFIRSAAMSGRPLADVFPAIPPVLSRTHYGMIWILRISALAVVALFSQAGRNFRDSPPVRYLMLALVVAVAWTESASGHASDLGDFSSREMFDLLHLLAASVWGGGLIVLSLVILPSLIRRGDIVMIAEISRLFSRMAGYAVLIILLTAVFNVKTYVGEFSALWKTPYGLTAVMKMVLLYFLILLGGFNRYVSVPLLQHVAGSRIEGPGLMGYVAGRLFDRVRSYVSGHVVAFFGKIVLVEAMLMLAVFFCAAGLKHETPPTHLMHLEQEKMEHAVQQKVHDVNRTNASNRKS